MIFTRYFKDLDPHKFLEFSMLRNHMDKALQSMRGGFEHLRENFTGVFPLINVGEDDDHVVISAELPGVKSEDLDISVKNDTLTIKGEKKVGPHPQDANFYRRERHEGVFSRILTLPAKVEPENVEAVFKNGILTVTFPKAAEAKSRQITIKNE
ncbi:MAG: Hsp20/alpha crystallin family protein [Deltaproteobacteria bacterium]|jgi:HSP20 family protein|nr:Hsp20/alpha crystallin family protein [Deltaproteobacteria bacterium]